MGGVRLKHGRVACLAGVLGVVGVLGATHPGIALLLAPGLVLFALLTLGFAPGEQLIERMRARRFPRRAERAPRTLAVRHVVVVRRITPPAASALAMRPPPAGRAGVLTS